MKLLPFLCPVARVTLISRLNWLPMEKIDAEIAYLRIGLEKTAGDRELEAWSWLMQVIDEHKTEQTL